MGEKNRFSEPPRRKQSTKIRQRVFTRIQDHPTLLQPPTWQEGSLAPCQTPAISGALPCPRLPPRPRKGNEDLGARRAPRSLPGGQGEGAPLPGRGPAAPGKAVWRASGGLRFEGTPEAGLLEAAGGLGAAGGARARRGGGGPAGGRRGPGARGRARPPPLTRVLLAQERVLLLPGAEAALGRAARLLLGQPREAGDAHVVHGRAGGQGPLPASPRLRRHRHRRRHRPRRKGPGRAAPRRAAAASRPLPAAGP